MGTATGAHLPGGVKVEDKRESLYDVPRKMTVQEPPKKITVHETVIEENAMHPDEDKPKEIDDDENVTRSRWSFKLSNHSLICTTILKVIELVFCCFCLAFGHEAAAATNLKHYTHYVGVMYTAYCGYILINSVILVGSLLGDRMPFKTYGLFNIFGVVLFVLTGILLVLCRAELVRNPVYQPPDRVLNKLVASIVFAFLSALVYGIDILVSVAALRRELYK